MAAGESMSDTRKSDDTDKIVDEAQDAVRNFGDAGDMSEEDAQKIERFFAMVTDTVRAQRRKRAN